MCFQLKVFFLGECLNLTNQPALNAIALWCLSGLEDETRTERQGRSDFLSPSGPALRTLINLKQDRSQAHYNNIHVGRSTSCCFIVQNNIQVKAPYQLCHKKESTEKCYELRTKEPSSTTPCVIFQLYYNKTD